MKNKEEFPKEWHILITELNYDILKAWREQKLPSTKGATMHKDGYITHEGRYGDEEEYSLKNGRKRITFEEFEKYILNKEPSPKEIEDLSYLNNLIKQLTT